MEVTGRDGVLESIHEIRSVRVNCQAEGVSCYKCAVEPHGSILPYREIVLQTVGTHTVMASNSWQRRVIHAAGSQNH